MSKFIHLPGGDLFDEESLRALIKKINEAHVSTVQSITLQIRVCWWVRPLLRLVIAWWVLRHLLWRIEPSESEIARVAAWIAERGCRPRVACA